MSSYFTAGTAEADRENRNPYIGEIRGCANCDLHRWHIEGAHACPGHFNALPLDVLFIGMSPGADEDRVGRPFVGRAGKLLFRLYGQVFDTDAWGVTNVVRCHTPENRPPRIMEVAACSGWLQQEIWTAVPKVAFLLGNSAIPLAFGKAKIGQVHGQARVWTQEVLGRRTVAIACYHPAAALRNNALVPKILEAFRLGKELINASY